MKKIIIAIVIIWGILCVIGFIAIINDKPIPKTETEIQAEQQLAQKQALELATWQKTPAGVLCTKHPNWSNDDCNSLTKKQIWIGMTVDMILYLRGNPDHKNVSNYGRGDQYQLCWNDYTPSCFYFGSDGISTAYN